jgi:hypothetical protein
MIVAEELDRYDIAFHSWGAQDPAVAEQVRRVDRLCWDFVRALFAEMGFEGTDLDDRPRILLVFVIFVSARRTVQLSGDDEDMTASIARYHAFFPRPGSET